MSSGGQCYSCGSDFGIFRKEHGCKNCGFIFCSKCLSKKIEVPRLNNSKGSVCNGCFALLKGDLKKMNNRSPPLVSGGPLAQHQFPSSPPLAYKKRMEALKVKELSSGHSSSSSLAGAGGKKKPGTAGPTMYHGMSKADIEIAERLERLRDRPKCDVETVEQLENRLAAIKRIDPPSSSSSRCNETKKKNNNSSSSGGGSSGGSGGSGPQLLLPATDRRTQQEQIDDLLEEIASSVALDASLSDPDVLIQQRLDRLRRDSDHRQRKKTHDDDDDDDDDDSYGGGGGGGSRSRTSSINTNSSTTTNNTTITSTTTTTTTTNLPSVSSNNNNNNNYNNRSSHIDALLQPDRMSINNLSSSSSSPSSARKPTAPSLHRTTIQFKDTTCDTTTAANTNTVKVKGNTTTTTNTNTLSLSEFLSNNLNKASCGPDKQPYEKNINFGCCGDAAYAGFDSININALMTEVKQVKEEVERNLKRSGSDNVMRAGDRKSWKNFDYTEADLQKEADEIARRLTSEALREKEEEEKNKQ